VRIRFTKVEANGADYLVVNTADSTCRDWPAVARSLCRRRRGVGADGLVVLDHLGHARFTARCVNPDGTPSPADGNALRAATRAVAGRYGYRTVTLLSGGVSYATAVERADVAVELTATGADTDPVATAAGPAVHLVHVDGGEHAVTVVTADELAGLDVRMLGAGIRRDPAFAPAGTNAGFAAVLEPGRLRLRSYERGVERETPSSASGAVAAVLVTRRLGLTRRPEVAVETGGGPLTVTLLGGDRARVTGTATEVFDGDASWTPEPVSALQS
jgi:diaminopimelate epimerase